ncbi:MAG: hypothetical protein ABIU95_16710, partial [Burkholderiales bacterium]
SAQFLAALGFWAGLPWTLKMPVGHVVDLIWRWKGWLIFIGAGLLAVSLLIMVGLMSHRAAMEAIMSVERWFITASLLGPLGYVVQDVVADAMTVEAVPLLDDNGVAVPDAERKLQHTTMQLLGRVAIIGGSALVAGVNVWMFSDAAGLPKAEKAALYTQVYWYGLVIPVVSVLGVILGAWLVWRRRKRLQAKGLAERDVLRGIGERAQAPAINWWLLGGGLAFVIFSLVMGTSDNPWRQEIVFAGGLGIVIFLISRLVRELDPAARNTLLATAFVIFIFRATPGVGPGAGWWQIDELKFDEAFLAKLGFLATTLTLAGLFLFRRFIAERSITYVVGFLTVIGTILSLPTLAMYYGLHEWTAAHTGGIVDARFIALIDTALESPLGQVAMVPMLAWIANSAPEKLKATFFAIMASFTNLALSAGQLGTKYLNEVYTVTREVKDLATGAIKVPKDYSQLGELLIVAILIGLIAPFIAILITRMLRWKTS